MHDDSPCMQIKCSLWVASMENGSRQISTPPRRLALFPPLLYIHTLDLSPSPLHLPLHWKMLPNYLARVRNQYSRLLFHGQLTV
jgi:hypothetical protein